MDVTNENQIKETIKKVLELGDVDVVYNNAGYGLMGPLESYSDEQIIRQLNTNLLGVILVTKAFIPYFREKKGGLFLSTTSIGGVVTFPFSSIYHAAKWGIEGWSESMSYELGLNNIQIKTIAPGGIKTDFAGRSVDFVRDENYAEALQKFNAIFDESSYNKPEEVAEVVYEAATDSKNQLRYVVGATAQYLASRRDEIGREKQVEETYNGIFKQ
ncbi:SDR family NAD(P)-dependent oxidoreductase [Chryseobacterium artocarpi]|uniref:SDR family NAD(P)-dependent oxidoreductase n=1 Tax=Chryseobacterium artocarpi TaxID=1414727 RepID=UPI000B14CE37|nr:SDR family NAD(P)-dependent oxidoreductase [Chryseobacterium artocarpi]